MKAVCTQCKELHEIHQITKIRCPVCQSLMSVFEKDIIEVSLAQKMKKIGVNKIEEEGLGL